MNRCLTLGVRAFCVALVALWPLASPLTAHAQSLPSGWSSRDIGSVGAAGSANEGGGWLGLRGAGADVWGTADGFHFAYRSLTGDGEVLTRVWAVDYIHAWSKAGVMMRESLSPGARHAFVLASAGKGLAFQRRAVADGASTSTAGRGGLGSFVRITRTGNMFDAYESADGSTWVWVGSEWIDMPATIYVGVAVTSHAYGITTNATFSHTTVNAWSGTPAAVGQLPAGWASSDVGGVATGGWSDGSGGDIRISGSGADIWDGSDEFQFAYRALSGDGAIVARIAGVEYLHEWSKGGVMMRESLSPGSPHAFMLASAGNGLAFQRRVSQWGQSSHTGVHGWAAPSFLKLVRTGHSFDAYISGDGWTWVWVGGEWIPMGSMIYVGLAVTSHADGAVSTATFSNVDVVQGSNPAPAPAPEPPPPAPEPPLPAPEPPPPTPESLPEPPPVTPANVASLRLLQWNVRHGGIGTDGRYDPDRIAAWIAYLSPDVVTLNEVDDEWQMEAITQHLNNRTGINWNVTHHYKNAVLSRLPVHSRSFCTYNWSYGRTAAHASVVVNGRTVNIWAAHLDVNSAETRWSELSLLRGCMDSWAEGRVLAGDFNMQWYSPEYVAATSEYIDGWSAAKAQGTAYNYSGNCDGCTRNSRIDYVFSSWGASWLTVGSAEVVDTRDVYGYTPSDHKPLIVTYQVN